MFSLIKGQVIKPFLKFTKNLSADQINLSVLKGEGELKSLELEETTLMELLDLPTWLYLRKAHCSNISFKIRWTKLDTHPVCVVIDRVDVELEALDEPRPATDSMFASYRTGSGKYKLADKVVDGASVLVNTVFIRFSAQAFQASIELSRLTLVSKTPKWQNGTLNLTSLPLPAGDAVLVFKEISWDSVRLVADGLLNEFSGIPVKLITNAGRIRLTLKKRLSDSALISSRIQLILDDLLWVLTLSQLEAAIVFLRSLKRSVLLAAEQSRQYAESRAKRQTLGWQNTIQRQEKLKFSASATPVPTKQDNLANMDQYSLAARIFRRYDVVETSYHFCVYRTEIHFCDETKEDSHLSQIIVPNGYIKVHLFGVELDWYPYHVELSPQARWQGSRDFREARDNWLASLNRAHFRQARPAQQKQPLDPLLNVPTGSFQSINSSSPFPSVELSNIQGVFILRIRDLDVSRVSFPNGSNVSGAKPADYGVHSRDRYANEELPSSSHLFLATDKKLHCLSENTNFVTAEFRFTYNLRTSHGSKYNPQSPPSIFFAQLKPFYLRFDADTVIWLNAFLLTLHVNLSAFAQMQPPEHPNENEPEQTSGDHNCRNPLHLRCEALMPRVILPFRDTKQSNIETALSSPALSGPDALVIQLDQVLIELLAPPLNQTTASVLERLLVKQASASAVDHLATARGQQEARTHIPVDITQFAQLAASVNSFETSIPNTNSTDYYWCIHCPHLWAQFLTVVDVFEPPMSKRAALGRTKCSLYRQSFLEPVPLTIWASMPLSAPSDPIQTTRPPLQILVDCDCSMNPLDTERHGLFNHLDKPEPITLFLGHVPSINGGMCWAPSVNQRLPDALDQLLFLCDLANQLSQVKDQLGLDVNRIYNLPNHTVGPLSSNDSQVFYTLAFVVQRRIQFHVVPLDDLSNDEHSQTIQQSSGFVLKWDRSNPTQSQKLAGDSCPSGARLVHRSKSPSKNPQNASFVGSIDLQTDPQKKKDPSYPILPTNRQLDDFTTKSYSVSDILSASNNSVDNVSIAGSQDNWLNTYEVLFQLDDELKDSDCTSLSSSSGYGAGSKLSSTTHDLEEVGTELFELQSTRSSQRSTNDLEFVKSDTGRSSRLSQRGIDEGTQRESTCEPEIHVDQSIPAVVLIFQLDGVIGEADATDTEMRSWLKLGPISLTCQSEESSHDYLTSTTAKPSWAAFVSVIRHVIHDSAEGFTDQTTYQTSMCLHADLLADWSLHVPSLVLQAAGQFLNHFNARGGLDKLQSVLNRGTLLREIQTPLPAMDINLHLKRGFLALEIESNSNSLSSTNELIKKLHLQQGLSLRLDKNAVLSVGLANLQPAEAISVAVLPASGDKDHSDQVATTSEPFPPNRSTGPSNLLRQYQQENVQLKENIRLLNSTIAKLNVELATAKHMLDLMQQR